MIANKNEAKAMTEHISYDENSIAQYAIQMKNGIIKHVNVNVRIIVKCKKGYSWNPRTYICENSI